MAFSILHTADLHLGKSFRGLPPKQADQRRQDLLDTLRHICEIAHERDVDLLIIAGDLFDRPLPTAALRMHARSALADARVPVLLTPGNHDPLDVGSPYLTDQWPANVRVAREPGWQSFNISGREVWGFGYTTADAHQGAWEHFPGCEPDAVIALHATCLLPGLGDEERYFRFRPGEIPNCAYLALGHHHRCAAVSQAPLACYSGAPEPLEPQESESGALLVDIDGETATRMLLPLALRRHREVTVDVTGRRTDEVYKLALAAVSHDDLLAVRLTGLMNPDDPIDAGVLEAELEKDVFFAQVDDSGLLIPEEVDESSGVMGALLAIARREIAAMPPSDPQYAVMQRAARYAQLALEGKL